MIFYDKRFEGGTNQSGDIGLVFVCLPNKPWWTTHASLFTSGLIWQTEMMYHKKIWLEIDLTGDEPDLEDKDF